MANFFKKLRSLINPHIDTPIDIVEYGKPQNIKDKPVFVKPDIPVEPPKPVKPPVVDK